MNVDLLLAYAVGGAVVICGIGTVISIFIFGGERGEHAGRTRLRARKRSYRARHLRFDSVA